MLPRGMPQKNIQGRTEEDKNMQKTHQNTEGRYTERTTQRVKTSCLRVN
jgi:hypothetical protein